MKKSKNYIFKSILVLGVAVLTSFVFVACGKTHLKVEGDIKEQMFAKEEYMMENVYGKESSIDFDNENSDNFVANSDYYVKVATVLKAEVAQVKLGEVTYSKTDKAETKVSSVNTITRDVFFVDQGTLYISNVLMFLNTSNDGVLKINFPKNDFMQIMVKVYEGEQNTLKLKVVEMVEGTLTMIDEANLKHKFSIDNPNGKLFFELKNADNSVDDSVSVFVQTVANPSKNNQTYASRFENPTVVSNSETSGVEVSPGYNQGEEYTQTTPANHTLIYNIYIPSVGAKTVTIEFVNTKTA